MPSATSRILTGFSDPRQLSYPASYRAAPPLIGTHSWEAIGQDLCGNNSAFSSQTYVTANLGLGFMFCLPEPYLVTKVWWMNGTTATTDSADVGVYTEDGGTRLLRGGGAVIATANVVQEIDITDVLLPAGRFWLVYAQSGTTATPMQNPGGGVNLRCCGVAQQANAYSSGLISTWTPAVAISGTTVPLFGIANRTQVA